MVGQSWYCFHKSDVFPSLVVCLKRLWTTNYTREGLIFYVLLDEKNLSINRDISRSYLILFTYSYLSKVYDKLLLRPNNVIEGLMFATLLVASTMLESELQIQNQLITVKMPIIFLWSLYIGFLLLYLCMFVFKYANPLNNWCNQSRRIFIKQVDISSHI